MSHDELYVILANIAEVCFWVIVVSMPLAWAGHRAMVLLSRKLPPSTARNSLNDTFGELVAVLLPPGLVAALGAIIVRFVAQNTHAPWPLRLEGFAALFIWLRVMGLLMESATRQLNSEEKRG